MTTNVTLGELTPEQAAAPGNGASHDRQGQLSRAGGRGRGRSRFAFAFAICGYPAETEAPWS